MIGLNGPLFALLCAAYFVIVVCLLGFGRAAADGDRAQERHEQLVARERARQPARPCGRMRRETLRHPMHHAG